MSDKDDATDRSDPAQPPHPLACAECGDRIDRTEWHPVLSTTDDDGTFRVHAFCSQECRNAWRTREE